MYYTIAGCNVGFHQRGIVDQHRFTRMYLHRLSLDGCNARQFDHFRGLKLPVYDMVVSLRNVTTGNSIASLLGRLPTESVGKPPCVIRSSAFPRYR